MSCNGKCTFCDSPGVNMKTCPRNPEATNIKPRKHFLAGDNTETFVLTGIDDGPWSISENIKDIAGDEHIIVTKNGNILGDIDVFRTNGVAMRLDRYHLVNGKIKTITTIERVPAKFGKKFRVQHTEVTDKTIQTYKPERVTPVDSLPPLVLRDLKGLLRESEEDNDSDLD